LNAVTVSVRYVPVNSHATRLRLRPPRYAASDWIVVASASEVAAAVDDVGAAVEQRAHHRDVILRVVLEIGVLDDQQVAGRRCDAGAHGASLAAIVLLAHRPTPGTASTIAAVRSFEQSSTTMISMPQPSGADRPP
jgi:hypothetical protein